MKSTYNVTQLLKFCLLYSFTKMKTLTAPGYTRKTFPDRVLSFFLRFLLHNRYSQFLTKYHEHLLLYIMISIPIVTYSKLVKLRIAMQHTPSTNPLPFLYAIHFLQTTTHNWHSKIYSIYIIHLIFFNHTHASDINPQRINKRMFWTTMIYKKTIPSM